MKPDSYFVLAAFSIMVFSPAAAVRAGEHG
jgi:hypothetical protein